MSVQSEVNRIPYVGNNSNSTPYAVPFYFFENSDLVVVVTDSLGVDTTLTLNTDYSVTGAMNEAGGSITTTAAVPSTSRVTIYRELDATQLSVYTENARFPAKTQEKGLDRLTMLVQQALRSIKRSFTVRASDDEMTDFAAVANSVVGFNASKQARTYTLTELQSFLSISGSIVIGMPTKTFADAGERAAGVAAFTGQLATQRDTGAIYIATGLAAGAWHIYPYDGTITAAMLASTLNLASKTITYPNAQIPTAALIDSSVTTAKIANQNVTYGKIAPNTVDFTSAVRGLTVTRFSNTRVDITMDSVAIVATDGLSVVRFIAPSTINLLITASGLNGLDTGTEANSTWYYIWLVSNGTTLGAILSTSATAPTMPSGYTYKMLVSAIRNNSSGNFMDMQQAGNRASCTAKAMLSSITGVTSLTNALNNDDNGFPPNAVYVTGIFGRSVASAADWNMTVYGDGGSVVGGGRSSAVALDGFSGSCPFRIKTPNAGASIPYIMGATTATAFSLYITGWEFNF